MQNLTFAIISFFVFIVLTLFVAKFGKVYLYSLSTSFILISNVTVQLNVEILPDVMISWAIIIYSLVYLITDLTIEFYGRAEAYKLATLNLSTQLIFWLYIWSSLKILPSDSGNSIHIYEMMTTLFSANSKITIAAVLAAIGPYTDIYTTHRIRNYLSRRRFFGGELASLVARAKLSTFIGEIVNTSIFFTIASLGTGLDSSTLTSVIITATITKWIISVADIPFLLLYFKHIGFPADASDNHFSSRV